MVSRFRPHTNIIGITTDEKIWRELSLSWGVTPVLCESFNSTDVLFFTASRLTKEVLKLNTGDRIVMTGGVTNGKSGNTNLIKVENV